MEILFLRSIPESVWQIVDDESIVALAGGYLVVGFLVGTPQWLLLRMRFENASLWLVASALAPALGLALVLFTNLIDWSEFNFLYSDNLDLWNCYRLPLKPLDVQDW